MPGLFEGIPDAYGRVRPTPPPADSALDVIAFPLTEENLSSMFVSAITAWRKDNPGHRDASFAVSDSRISGMVEDFIFHVRDQWRPAGRVRFLWAPRVVERFPFTFEAAGTPFVAKFKGPTEFVQVFDTTVWCRASTTKNGECNKIMYARPFVEGSRMRKSRSSLF